MSTFNKWLARMGTYRHDPPAQSRETDFSYKLTFEDRDLSGATFIGEVKISPGLTTAALATMSFTTAVYASDDTVTTASIAQSVVNGLPESDDKSEPVELSYDIYVTPSGGSKELVMGGIFVVNPGVTQS